MKRVFAFLFSVCVMAVLAVMTTGCDKLTEEKAASVETEKEPATAAPEDPTR